MLLKLIIFLVAMATGILASPLNMTVSQSLHKRLNRRPGPDVELAAYTKVQIDQIKHAHKDAVLLASKVVSSSATPDVFDPIFKKYFNIADRDGVLNVFKQIVGPENNGDGNLLLRKMTAVKDYVHDDGDGPQLMCKDEYLDQMGMRDVETDSPKLIVCKEGFELGAINVSFPGRVQGVTCGDFMPRITREMQTLGSVLLREYMHWSVLISPVLWPAFGEKFMRDIDLGCWDVRLIDKDKAVMNPDSYVWLALHLFWSEECKEDFGDLHADPNEFGC